MGRVIPAQRYLDEAIDPVLAQYLPFRELLRRTLLLLQKYGKEELTNRTVWLQDFQLSPEEP